MRKEYIVNFIHQRISLWLPHIHDDDISLSLLPRAHSTILTNHKRKKTKKYQKKWREEKKTPAPHIRHVYRSAKRLFMQLKTQENSNHIQYRKEKKRKKKHSTHSKLYIYFKKFIMNAICDFTRNPNGEIFKCNTGEWVLYPIGRTESKWNMRKTTRKKSEKNTHLTCIRNERPLKS